MASANHEDDEDDEHEDHDVQSFSPLSAAPKGRLYVNSRERRN
jgi:hypothetical protein